MSLRQEFTKYRAMVADRSNYPDVPEWVKELLLKRLDEMLALEDGDRFESVVRTFDISAAHFITENCSWEADELLEDMPGD